MSKSISKSSSAWGSHLRELREAKGLSIRAVARKSRATAGTREESLTDAYLSQLERCKARNPSIYKLAALARIYGVTFSTLLWELRRRGFQTKDSAKLNTVRLAFEETSHIRSSLEGPLKRYEKFAHASHFAVGHWMDDEVDRLMQNNDAFRGLVSALALGFIGGKRDRDVVQKIFWDFFFDWEPARTKDLLKKLRKPKTRKAE